MKQSPKSEKLKARIKRDLEIGFKMIKLHQQGKIKLKSAHDLLREL